MPHYLKRVVSCHFSCHNPKDHVWNIIDVSLEICTTAQELVIIIIKQC